MSVADIINRMLASSGRAINNTVSAQNVYNKAAAPVRSAAKAINSYTPTAYRAAATYSAPAPAPAPAPSFSDGGGGGVSSGGGGGSGGGSDFGGGSFAAAAPPPPAMETITVPDPLQDTGYQKTVADLARAAADFKAQQDLARGQYDTQYNDAKRRMGWDDTAGKFDRSRPGAYAESYNANEGDFAGRGTYWSGLYGQSVGDINRDFGDRKTSLDTARTDNVNTQGVAANAFTGQQDATRQAALNDAIQKLAAQYTVGLGDVKQGSANTITRQRVG